MESKVRRGIGLVAHDAMKKDLIEWVLWNSELLMGNKFYCTGTTGTLILEALKEKHPDEEWDFTILKSGPLGLHSYRKWNIIIKDMDLTSICISEKLHIISGIIRMSIDHRKQNTSYLQLRIDLLTDLADCF